MFITYNSYFILISGGGIDGSEAEGGGEVEEEGQAGFAGVIDGAVFGGGRHGFHKPANEGALAKAEDAHYVLAVEGRTEFRVLVFCEDVGKFLLHDVEIGKNSCSWPCFSR